MDLQKILQMLKEKILAQWGETRGEINKLLRCVKKAQRKFIAIDFSQFSVEVAYFESTGGKIGLIGWDIYNLSKEDDSSDKGVVDFIKSFIDGYLIEEKDVVLSISDDSTVFIQYLTLPSMPDSEITSAVKWQLKEDMPFDLDAASIDWQVIKEYFDDEGAKKKDLIVIFIQKESADHYLEIAEKCSLNVLSITSRFFAYANALKHFQPAAESCAVLDIDQYGSSLGIYKNNQLYFVRTLPVSWDKLVRSLMEIVTSEKGRTEFSNQDAVEILKTVGIPDKEIQAVNESVPSVHILPLIRPLLESLTREIRLSFDYFKSRFQSEAPGTLYLTGKGIDLKNLSTYLREETHVPVEHLSVPSSVQMKIYDPQKGLPEKAEILLRPIGAALGLNRDVNLLPAEIKSQKFEQLQNMVFEFCAIFFGLSFIIAMAINSMQIKDYTARLKNSKIQLDTIVKLETKKDKLELRKGLVDHIVKGKVPVEGVLKLLSNLIPDNIILSGLSLDQTAHTLVLKGKSIPSQGGVETGVTYFMQLLEESSFFSEASLLSSQKKGNIHVFEIKCDLEY